jgi:hypothetical protein
LPVILVKSLTKLAFSRHILVKIFNCKISRKCVKGSQVISCGRRDTDGGAVTVKLIAALRDFAKAPKMTKQLYVSKFSGEHE